LLLDEIISMNIYGFRGVFLRIALRLHDVTRKAAISKDEIRVSSTKRPKPGVSISTSPELPG